MPCKDVAKYICESDRIDEFAHIAITGGEPFIVTDLAEFINPVFSRFLHVRIDITTSGTLPQNVKDMLNVIPVEYLRRLSIAVSIDGVGDTHNAIRNHYGAYEKALAALRICVEYAGYGVSYGINMVVHSENIGEIDELSAAACRISPHCHVAVIPLCTSVSHGEDFPYNDTQIEKISRYITDVFHIKYLCSQGEPPVAKCVTGVDNVVVMPNGNMYACLVGAAYRDNSDDSYFGNITGGFDKAFANNARCFKNIKNCVLCNNPCDINRQKRTQHMSFHLTSKEQVRYFTLFGKSAYYQGFYQLETHDDGTSHRWMAQTVALVTLKTTYTERFGLAITIGSNLPKEADPILLDITSNGKMLISDYITGSRDVLCFRVEGVDEILKVEFRISKTWKPSEVFGSGDTRDLGLALYDIVFARQSRQ
jgi:sulfatase maturation enzyme AslB (radical SAM superfamily)